MIFRDRGRREGVMRKVADWISLAVGVFFGGLLIVFAIIGIQEVGRERAERVQQQTSTPDEFELRFARTLGREPFFRSLSPKRQAIVRGLAVRSMTLERMREEIERDWAKIGGTLEARYTVDQSDLTLAELKWLKDKGVIEEPEWPGYTTHRTERGIFVLLPDAFQEGGLQ